MALPSGIVLDGEGIIGWPTMLFSRPLKCDRWSLKLVMTRPTMNSLILLSKVERASSCIKTEKKKRWPSRHLVFSLSYKVVDCCLCHLSSLRVNALRYHVAKFTSVVESL